MRNSQLVKSILFAAMLLVTLAGATATQLGMNYYHESMMRSGGHYIDRSPAQVSADLDDIKTLTSYVKVYANPFFDDNIDWVAQVTSIAKSKGMHVVVVMNTEDREINDGNWQEYHDRVLNAASRLNGNADEFIVGNEMKLHSPWSAQQIYDHVAPLISDAKGRFNGPVSYEAFYYERDPWLDYTGKVYINMYEHYPTFEANLKETSGRMGSRLVIGEFGELTDDGNGWPVRGEAAQADDVAKRWDAIKATATPVAYVFTYREPSGETGFGLMKPDGSKKQLWSRLGGSRPAATPVKAAAPARTVFKAAAPKPAATTWKMTDAAVAKKMSAREARAARLKAAREARATRAPKASRTKAAKTTSLERIKVSGTGDLLRSTSDGSCRDLSFSDAQAKLCAKDGGYELYFQSGSGTVCAGGACVGSQRGYAKV